MRFAHLADIHLGFEQYRLPYRAEEFAQAFRETIEKVVEEKVDFILIAGDLFHQSRPSPETIKEAIEILSIPKENGIPVFAIEGNHDRTQRRISAYHLLESLDLLYLVGLREEKVENEYLTSEKIGGKYLVKGVFERGGKSVEIHGLKYMSAAWLERNRLSDIFKPESDAILMLHQGIKELIERMMGVIPESQRDYFELKMEDLPKGYVYYALGHIHRRFETNYDIGKVVYPGSLQRWDFGDYELRYRWDGRAFKPKAGIEKGFYIVEDFEPRFVELKVRPFVDIRIEADEETAKREIKRLSTKIPSEAFVRLDLKWERPFDVSTFRDLLDVKYLYIRTRFERKLKTAKGGELPRPSEYFLPVELKAIELTGEKKFEAVDAVVELFLGEGWDEKPKNKPREKPEEKLKDEEKPTEKDEISEKREAKKLEKVEKKEETKAKVKPKKGSDLLAWLGGER
ncbi:exonuclease SbcCD subunit D [Thermococcus sp. GR7]|uniref:DNA double-strand break repair protein Mre11 n=1 Tax=unclassified Thermococcus TaxID=2627626 RepID=UPI00143155D0|nr:MULTISPECIES: DNA double-strand break repair protein Mre11 [unclassified Thermococcus]NJE46752.1 exonuclease SbcCD subunit D [Thermococcus sp. GR7]NJE77820.1 exonuclease SbcCD subunit D [Thermococcus sp. GR4]NJF22948.1 exonuclease SbcCD subunit D [Thermococcus sp. GR5]